MEDRDYGDRGRDGEGNRIGSIAVGRRSEGRRSNWGRQGAKRNTLRRSRPSEVGGRGGGEGRRDGMDYTSTGMRRGEPTLLGSRSDKSSGRGGRAGGVETLSTRI